jgi:signal transduction histidine kinase
MNRQANIGRKPLFISLRWRFITPLAIVIAIVAMIGAYFLATQMASGFAVSEENVLVQSSQAIANRAVSLYQRQRSEAQRVAFTQGIAEAIITNDVTSLHDSLESLAAAADLDSIIVTDPAGLEVAGVLRVRNSDALDYSVSNQTDLSTNPLVLAVINEDAVGVSGFLQTPQGLLLFVAVPIVNDGSFAGVALIGQALSAVVDSLRASAVAGLSIHNEQGELYYTTLPLETRDLPLLAISAETAHQSLSSNVPVASTTTLGSTRYRNLYMPFNYGEKTLGVIGVLVADNVPFASAIGRQLAALFAAGLAGSAVFVGFALINNAASRIEKVTQTAQSLSLGHRDSRTSLKAVDEIGAMGVALDVFALSAQRREDQLYSQLNRQRRESMYLLSVLEAMPDGVVVQDKEGKVILMNEQARMLLGSQADFRQQLQAIEERLPEVLGTALAPGIYALGNPLQLAYQGKMLSAQAAAVQSSAKQRIGTVILLRDITSEVQQEQAREELLSQLSEDIQQPLSELSSAGATQPNRMVQEFARDISRHAAALQKMIVDMRELTKYSPEHARQMQRPLLAETLIYAIANDWRQIAQAANLELRVMIEKTGIYVLGDESRLRWAIGNIVDNAIKYTQTNGALTLEIKDEVDGYLHLRVRDNGVGISDGDLQNVFMPFYRGTPTGTDGQVIRVPGMGQGLHLARQVLMAHGGAMKVKSRIGVGTAVYFALPITSGESYALPLFANADMEGETIKISDKLDFEAIWQKN